jgi:hypothetical protein
VSDPGEAPVYRRRRTRRHRRNRLIRLALVVAALAVFAVSFSSFALRFFAPSMFRATARPPEITYQELQATRNGFATKDLASPPSRPVYPYSVVPGGVRNAKELKWIAEHDPVVAAHYAGFDYERARLVRLVLAQTVYVSYRIGNHIYWTRHRITLRKGETLLTDGKITGRTRCANRVEELPQQATSPAEPPAEKFEQPVRAGNGTAVQSPPVPFESALLHRPMMPGVEPAAPISSLYSPFVGGNYPLIAPPPLPRGATAGTCLPTPRKKTSSEAIAESFAADSNGKKKKTNPCGGATTVVPEPGSWLMLSCGLGLTGWLTRRKFAHV